MVAFLSVAADASARPRANHDIHEAVPAPIAEIIKSSGSTARAAVLPAHAAAAVVAAADGAIAVDAAAASAPAEAAAAAAIVVAVAVCAASFAAAAAPAAAPDAAAVAFAAPATAAKTIEITPGPAVSNNLGHGSAAGAASAVAAAVAAAIAAAPIDRPLQCAVEAALTAGEAPMQLWPHRPRHACFRQDLGVLPPNEQQHPQNVTAAFERAIPHSRSDGKRGNQMGHVTMTICLALRCPGLLSRRY